MPQWIHSRAEHLLAKNPDMKKSTAFAIATQQSHALGKTPKSYGTAEGRYTAKAKYDTPKDDKKMANPGGLRTPKLKHADAAQNASSGARFVRDLVGGRLSFPKHVMTAAERAATAGHEAPSQIARTVARKLPPPLPAAARPNAAAALASKPSISWTPMGKFGHAQWAAFRDELFQLLEEKTAAEHLELQHDPMANEAQPEGGMSRSRLHHMTDMAGRLMEMIHDEDHLPPWVADHITTAHENLSQVYSYVEPKVHEAMHTEVPLPMKLAAFRAGVV